MGPVPLFTAVLLGLLSLFAFSRQSLVGGSPAGEETILLERDREFDRVTAEKGLEGFLSFIAEEAAFFPANAPIALGREGARSVWAPALTTPGVSIRWQPLKADLARSGELGYTYGTYESRGADAEGKPVTRYGKYVTIWKKQPDGVWKMVVDIGTPSLTPSGGHGSRPERSRRVSRAERMREKRGFIDSCISNVLPLSF